MASRLDLHEILCSILGSRNVYFQPPESIKLEYDCIIYSRKNIDNVFADNSVYRQHDSYEVIIIYEDPDSDIPRKLSLLPMCSFDRHYTSDNLNHDVFTLYY